MNFNFRRNSADYGTESLRQMRDKGKGGCLCRVRKIIGLKVIINVVNFLFFELFAI